MSTVSVPTEQGSAAAVLDAIFKRGAFARVVEIGNGAGHWLVASRARGATEITAVADAAMPVGKRALDASLTRPHDLNLPLPQLGRQDLAVCLNVAERLSPDRGLTLVDELTGLAPTVVFCAAIPGQGGQGHVNEQWQSHWAARFAERGYLPVESLRRSLWAHPEIKDAYRQNLLVYAGVDSPLAALRVETPTGPELDVIHPEFFSSRRRQTKQEKAAAQAAADAGASAQPPIIPVPPVVASGTPLLDLSKPFDEATLRRMPTDHLQYESSDEALDQIVALAGASTPFSLIRLSHCEAKFLTYPNIITRIEINRSLKRQFGYKDVSDAELAKISGGIEDAVRSADIIGLPLMTPKDWRKVDEGDEGWRLFSLVAGACVAKGLLPERAMLVSQNVHMALMKAHILDRLRETKVKIGLVSCRDLRPHLNRLGFDDVSFIQVPEAFRTRDADAQVERHYPDGLQRILGEIAAEKDYRVYLLGAGYLGKIYCNAIKQAGSASIDMGSVMDLWAGVPSRTGHENIIDQVSLAGTV